MTPGLYLYPWNSTARILEPFPFPGDLSNPGIQPRYPALQAESLLSEPPGKPHIQVYSSLLNSQLLRWICGRDSLSKNIPCHSPPGPKQSVPPCLSPHLLPYRLPKVPETRQGSPCLRAFAPAVLSAQNNLPSIPRKWQLLIHPASLKCHLLREAFPDTPPFVAPSQPR